MNEETQSRVIGFLGLCKRAGRVISGQEACVDLIRGGGAALALMDAGASENTRKRVLDACRSHGVPLWTLEAGALGHAIGQRGRMVAVLEPDGMAEKLLSMLPDGERL